MRDWEGEAPAEPRPAHSTRDVAVGANLVFARSLEPAHVPTGGPGEHKVRPYAPAGKCGLRHRARERADAWRAQSSFSSSGFSAGGGSRGVAGVLSGGVVVLGKASAFVEGLFLGVRWMMMGR